ncbi:EpsG family protein [Actinobacillus equuli]|uniref:EpsG family protein n=1 Tax=Actinobacillus equuli TaxID=718 RepID=UPI0024466BD8|nr:EpsG family protein [Actinobacillus equuli]WGE83400.1 EpsG family protein [Actinobacillus equuli subsp. equuli]
MEPYLIILFLLMVSSIFDVVKVKQKDLFFIFNFFFVFCLATFRYRLGSDYLQYENLFSLALPIDEISFYYLENNPHNIEYGYLILESLIKYFSNDFAIFVLFYNLLLFLFIYKGISISNNKNVQLLLIYCFWFLIYIIEAYRQAMAMAIIFCAFKYIYNGRFYIYLIMCLFASLFHSIALLPIALYPIINRKITNKIWVIVFLSILLINYLNLIPKVISFLNDNLDIKFIKRVHYYFFIKEKPTNSISILAYVQRIILIAIVLVFYNKVDYRYSNVMLIYPFLYFLFIDVGVLAARIAGIYLIAYGIYFSHLFNKLNNIYTKLFLVLYLLLYSGMIFYKDLHGTHPILGHDVYLPYKTIFWDRN